MSDTLKDRANSVWLYVVMCRVDGADRRDACEFYSTEESALEAVARYEQTSPEFKFYVTKRVHFQF